MKAYTIPAGDGVEEDRILGSGARLSILGSGARLSILGSGARLSILGSGARLSRCEKLVLEN
jgi:hypothetical protein